MLRLAGASLWCVSQCSFLKIGSWLSLKRATGIRPFERFGGFIEKGDEIKKLLP